MDTKKETKPEEGESIQLLVFELANEEYGVELTELKEIIEVPDITPIPNSPEFIRGISDLRGSIVIVVDLKNRFNLNGTKEEDKSDNRIVVTEINGTVFGLLVDKVTEILNAPESSVKKTPELVTGKINSDHLKGVSTLDERLILLLDLTKVLSDEELSAVSKEIPQEDNKEEEVSE